LRGADVSIPPVQNSVNFPGATTSTKVTGPLRDWKESLLDERKLRQQGLLDPKPARAKWAGHLSGRRNWQRYHWDVLMFQAWMEANSNVAPASEAMPAIVGP
jgi:asparagine synthase (glutamine-hydrolysing)